MDLKRDGKSFYWASYFLPKNSKKNAGILYSICRYFDDIADKNDDDKTLYLRDVIKEIDHNKYNKVNIFLKNNKIKNSIFNDLIEGLILDQKSFEIQNKEQLIKYSYHVAGSVGLMMSIIIGVKDQNARSAAIDLGIAMQLTNIARDVYEDAQMKRIYIPSDWIPNIELSDLKNKNQISNEKEEVISKAIYKIIDLSEKFYKNGFSGLKYIPLRARLGIFIAGNIYKGIGIKIKKNKTKYLKQRIYLNILDKIIITTYTIIIFFLIPFINYQYHKIRDNLPNENL